MFLFKNIHMHVVVDFNKYFPFNNNSHNARGSLRQLNVDRPSLYCRRFFFCNRVVKIWNGLPRSAFTLSRFHRRQIVLNNHSLSVQCKGRVLMFSSQTLCVLELYFMCIYVLLYTYSSNRFGQLVSSTFSAGRETI